MITDLPTIHEPKEILKLLEEGMNFAVVYAGKIHLSFKERNEAKAAAMQYGFWQMTVENLQDFVWLDCE